MKICQKQCLFHRRWYPSRAKWVAKWLDKARLAAHEITGLLRAYLFVPNMIHIALAVTNVLHDIQGDKAIREYPSSTLPAILNKLTWTTLLVK